MLKDGELLVVCSPRDKETAWCQRWKAGDHYELSPRDHSYCQAECHHPQLPENLSGLALQRVPQPGTNSPEEAHALLQTGATPAQPSCSDHSLHTSFLSAAEQVNLNKLLLSRPHVWAVNRHGRET